MLKKWLSYREQAVIGRPLLAEEKMEFTRIVRRVTEIVCMGPPLDTVHTLTREGAVDWVEGRIGG